MNLTRKEALTGIAGILAAGTAPAAVVRSMLGARGVATAGGSGGWVNPYVTDGLVAMWDAEWNDGPLKHISGSRIWRDLSGKGHDVNFDNTTNPSKIVVSDSYIEVSKGASLIVDGLTIAYGSTFTRTVETVFSVDLRTTSANGWDFTGWDDCGLILGCASRDMVTFRATPDVVKSVYDGTITPVSTWMRSAIVLDGIGNKLAARNDTTYNPTVQNWQYNSTSPIYYSMFSIANQGSDSRYRIKRICAYNRALSESELHYNYLEDVRRGLIS